MGDSTPPQVDPTREQKLAHDLGNSLSAARLRLDMILADPRCMEGQEANLRALGAAIDSARRFADQLEEAVWSTEMANLPTTDSKP